LGNGVAEDDIWSSCPLRLNGSVLAITGNKHPELEHRSLKESHHLPGKSWKTCGNR